MALCHEERDYAMGFTRRDPNPPRPLPKPRCKHYGGGPLTSLGCTVRANLAHA
jgi:hypothetical protein